MTKEEKIIATAFTGKMFIDGSEMGSLYEYIEKKVSHEVIDLMLASKEFWEELHKACEQDFIDMVSKEQPSLPSNLDEAAEEYAYNNWEDNDYHTGASEGLPFDAIGHTEKCFKAGAEWMAGQFQKIEGELVDWYSSPEGKDYCCGVKTIDSFEVPEGFYIRKK